MLLDTPVCDFGWQGPEFTLKDPSGQAFTMSEQLTEKGLLLMFICNHCPYVQRIAKQLAEDTQQLIDEGINVLAIMSNNYRDYPADSPQKMQAFAQQHGFAFPYLVDEEQSIGKQYGAVCTPDFFGFNGKGELQYRGNSQELLASMRLIAETGKGPQKQTPSMGCSIKWQS